MVRQQLLQGQSLLGRGIPGFEGVQVSSRRGPVQIRDRSLQARQVLLLQEFLRQQLNQRKPVGLQRVAHDAPQDALCHALGSRVDRGERVRGIRFRLVRGHLILGMHHLQTGPAEADLSVTGHPVAVFEVVLLRPGKVEEPDAHPACAVAYPAHQTATATIRNSCMLDPSGDQQPLTDPGRPQFRAMGPVLVAKRQVKQQILHRTDAKLLQSGGQLFSYALDFRDWCITRIGASAHRATRVSVSKLHDCIHFDLDVLG